MFSVLGLQELDLDLLLCRLSVCTVVQETYRVCALRDGPVMAKCVWRSITVCCTAEAAAAMLPATTSDQDR